MGITVFIIDNKLHHRRRHDKTSARSARQLLKVNLRWVWEIEMATFKLSEGMPQENTDVVVNVCTIQRNDATLSRSPRGYLAHQWSHLSVLKDFANMRFRATCEQNVGHR
jgi:hypothetical protein